MLGDDVDYLIGEAVERSVAIDGEGIPFPLTFFALLDLSGNYFQLQE